MKKTIATTLAAFALAVGGATFAHADEASEMQQDRDAVAAKLTSDIAGVVKCAENANKKLDVNDAHARRGYSNVAAWNFRRDIMNGFRECVRAAEAGDNTANNQQLTISIFCSWNDAASITTLEACETRVDTCRRQNNAWKYWDPLNTGIHIHWGAAESYRNNTIEPGYHACVDHVRALQEAQQAEQETQQ